MNKEDPYAYDDHVDSCAHLSKVAWNRFRHLPTAQALTEGERLDMLLKRIWQAHNEHTL